mmetsp:Transcript_36913/g.48918  ORF Transcript_36913/g.48918 Transcript_36913/m.48918 type:complete len:91 (+) Transcript_36913:282-554(+)
MKRHPAKLQVFVPLLVQIDFISKLSLALFNLDVKMISILLIFVQREFCYSSGLNLGYSTFLRHNAMKGVFCRLLGMPFAMKGCTRNKNGT